MRKRRQANRRGGHQKKKKRLTKRNATGFLESCQHSFMSSDRRYLQVKQAASYVRNARDFRDRPLRLRLPTTSAGSRPVWLQIFRRVCELLCFCGPLECKPQGLPPFLCVHVRYIQHGELDSAGYVTTRVCKGCIMNFNNCQQQSPSLFKMLTAA